jgi:hypothetical protein
MINLKGFSESDGQVNPVLDPGRYYGIIKKVEIKPWASGKGSVLKLQFVAEQSTNEKDEMPAWAQKGHYIFHDISLPDPKEYKDKPDWVRRTIAEVKNLYVACGVEVEGDQIDPVTELVNQQCVAVVGIDRGGEKENESTGKSYYSPQHNIIKEFCKIPE